MQQKIKKPYASAGVLALLLAALLAAVLAGLCLGSQPYTLAQLWQALCTRGTDDPVWRVIAFVRVPRVLAGVLAGAALAVAGVLLQAVLNNAMASPNVIGVNAGAGFFALLAAVVAPAVPGAMQLSSFWGRWGVPCWSICWPGGQGCPALRWYWRGWPSAVCSQRESTPSNCSGRRSCPPRRGS